MAPNSQWALGLSLLGVVVFLWVASGFLVNAMTEEYLKPYFVTYLNTSLTSLYLPWGWHQRRHSPTKFSVYQTAKLSFLFFVLWFASNLLNNASYYYTTVQSATIISCSSSFFTLIIGAYVGVERMSIPKIAPLLITAVGIVLITNQDSHLVSAPPRAFLGNMLSLGSAFLYGVYTTLLKRQVGQESNLNTKLFFGFVGLFTLVGLWPFVILLDYLNIETFSLPPSSKIWVLLALNGAAIMVSDFCWVLSMLMTSPLVVSVGLSATIPLSMFGEAVLYHRRVSLVYLLGASLVGYSFWVINNSEEQDASGEEELGE
nr:ST.2 [Starmerella bombicola]